VIRPPDITSRVISSLDNGTGWRKLGEETKVPNRTVSVFSAAATRVGIVAIHGESARLRHAKWSRVQAWSKP
jgi:hypothetical protein